MSILTDEEIDDVEKAFEHGWHHIDFARAIEAAIMSNLAEQAVEPVARMMAWIGDDPYNKGRLVARTYDELSPNTYPDSWKEVDKLYTETQYIAAQQKAAEACAKVCDKSAHDWRGANSRQVEMAEAIRNGEWRGNL